MKIRVSGKEKSSYFRALHSTLGLKRHPLLHDAAFTAPQARKVDVTERLAMP